MFGTCLTLMGMHTKDWWLSKLFFQTDLKLCHFASNNT